MKTIAINIKFSDDVTAESILASWQQELKLAGANIVVQSMDDLHIIFGHCDPSNLTPVMDPPEILDVTMTTPEDDAFTELSSEEESPELVDDINVIPPESTDSDDTSTNDIDSVDEVPVEDEFKTECVIKKLSSEPLPCVLSKTETSKLVVSNLESDSNSIKFSLFDTQYSLPGSDDGKITLSVEAHEDKFDVNFEVVEGSDNKIIIGMDISDAISKE